jgi:hypothetical protein
MATPVIFTPDYLNFGAVSPNSTGPDISVDPSFGPPQISFVGALQIKNVPVDAKVTATVAGTPNLKVRDIIAMDWVWEDVDPSELPPGHRVPPPKVRVLEVSSQSDGQSSLNVTMGQYLLVRVEYAAPGDGDVFSGKLRVTGDTWDLIEIPVSFFLSGLSTTALNTPIELAQGTSTDLTVEIRVVAGPESNVRYEMSPTQLHAGVSIIGQNEFHATADSKPYVLQLRTAIDAPIGDTTLAINQFFLNKRTGFLVPVTVKPFDTIQKIHGLKIAPEPSALTLSFTTERASRPVATLWKRPSNDAVKDMIPANQLASADEGVAPKKLHSIRVGGLPVAVPLWFRIDADVEEAGVVPGAFANYEGQTATLQRVCVVRVWRIEVLQAGGDSDGPEDGNEIDFSMMVYDGATGQQLIAPTFAMFDSVDSGDVLTGAFGANDGLVQVARAPDTIVPYVFGVSQDTDGALPIIGFAPPWTLPSKQNAGSSDDGAWADSFGPFHPPTTVGDFNSATMLLNTGLTLLAFQAPLTFETIVTDPFGALNMVYVDL